MVVNNRSSDAIIPMHRSSLSWRYGVIQDLCAVDYHWTRSIATNLDIKTSLKIDDLDTLCLTVFIHHAVL